MLKHFRLIISRIMLIVNDTNPKSQSCPTSKCTWPLYETLGVCSECADITSYLTFACLTSKVDWLADTEGGIDMEWSYPIAPHCGYFLNASTDRPVLMSGYLLQPNATNGKGEALLHRSLPLTSMTRFTPLYGNGSILYKSLRNTIMDAIIVSSPDGTADSVYRNKTPVAQECVLTWCVKTIQSSFTWGGYTEEVVSTHFNTTTGPFAWNATPGIDETGNYTDIFYRESVNIDFRSTIYGVSNNTASETIVGFQDVFPATTTALNGSSISRLRYKTWSDGGAWNLLMKFNPWMAPNNVTQHMERLATAMTNTIRSAKDSQVLLRGDAFARETFIHISWAWLTFPFLLLVLSLVFLVLTIRKTDAGSEGAGMWKTSAMPALIYGLPKETQTRLAPVMWSKTKNDTKKIRIKLSPNIGWRVSGQSLRQLSPTYGRRRGAAPPGWI